MITTNYALAVLLLITASCVRSKNANDTEQAKVLANFSLGSFLPPVSKITLPKLPAIPKRNTITLTTTVLTQQTKYVPVHSTCLKLQNVQSICDGYLETIRPTPILPTTFLWRNTESEYDEEMVERRVIAPTSTQSIQPTASLRLSRINIIEPSEHEYEHARSDDLTPSMEEKSQPRSNFLEHLLGPKYEISTVHLTLTRVIQYTDHANKATLIATNCIPPNVHYPICEHPAGYSLHNKKQKLNEAIRQTVDKIYEHVNKFVMNNPYGFLGISPQDSGHLYEALNSNAISSIVRTAASFPVGRSVGDMKNIGESSN